MKVLITGASGQDGQYLIDACDARGYDVYALYRSDAQARVAPERVTPLVVDLEDGGSRLSVLVRELRPNRIFHLAAISSVAESWHNPAAAFRVNGEAAISLADAARGLHESSHPVRLLLASSAEIFGAPEDSPQDESTDIRPVSPYGVAKAAAHRMVQIYRSMGLHASNAIFYNHESPLRGEAFVTRKITMQVARIHLGLADTLYLGNLDASRDWGWAPDYVDAMLRIVDHDKPDDYIVASGVGHTVREFVAAAFSAVGISDWEGHVKVDRSFLRPAEGLSLVGDPARLRRTVGWEPTKAFSDIVKEMVSADILAIAARQDESMDHS